MNNSMSQKCPSIVICAEREKMEHLGEDAYTFSFRNGNNGYIAVYDGCGGMGARKYSKANNKTGARIASKLAAYLTDQFYNDQQFKFDGLDYGRLKIKFKESFNKVKEAIDNDGGLMLGGDLFKAIPTTVSIVGIQIDTDGKLHCEFLWAGDSRGYFLDNDGLCQITKDDLQTEEDAFTNLRSDGRMSNVVYADGDFYINERDVVLDQPVMIISSTDGAFGYYSTPMDFEYVILKTLFESNSADEWEQALTNAIIPITGDDFALCIATFGFINYKEMKKYYSKRYRYIVNAFINQIEDDTTEQELIQLWDKYKTNYYRR